MNTLTQPILGIIIGAGFIVAAFIYKRFIWIKPEPVPEQPKIIECTPVTMMVEICEINNEIKKIEKLQRGERLAKIAYVQALIEHLHNKYSRVKGIGEDIKILQDDLEEERNKFLSLGLRIV